MQPSDVDALRAELAALEADREALRHEERELEAVQEQLSALDAELTDVRERVARRLPVLDDIRIASPCKERWDDMLGDERVRFCVGCHKNVYNVSALTRSEVDDLVYANEGNLCVRLFRRADGTVLSADCPVGQNKKRRRRAIAGVALAAGAAIALSHPPRSVLGSTEQDARQADYSDFDYDVPAPIQRHEPPEHPVTETLGWVNPGDLRDAGIK